jgi:hypothetical protein
MQKNQSGMVFRTIDIEPVFDTGEKKKETLINKYIKIL